MAAPQDPSPSRMMSLQISGFAGSAMREARNSRLTASLCPESGEMPLSLRAVSRVAKRARCVKALSERVYTLERGSPLVIPASRMNAETDRHRAVWHLRPLSRTGR